MNKIYIILTHTGTILSKIIKIFTKDEFSHVSIALDEDLKQMYSFGRLNPYNPFLGGFVHENPKEGTFKRFFRTKACIFSIDVEYGKYLKLNEIIANFERNKKNYKFNTLGLFAIGLHKQLKRKNHFYCAEFVKYVLDNSGINLGLPEKMIRPEDFKNINIKTIEYKGLLRKYKKQNLLKEYIKTINLKTAKIN